MILHIQHYYIKLFVGFIKKKNTVPLLNKKKYLLPYTIKKKHMVWVMETYTCYPVSQLWNVTSTMSDKLKSVLWLKAIPFPMYNTWSVILCMCVCVGALCVCICICLFFNPLSKIRTHHFSYEKFTDFQPIIIPHMTLFQNSTFSPSRI